VTARRGRFVRGLLAGTALALAAAGPARAAEVHGIPIHDDRTYTVLRLDRLEWRARDGTDDGLLWDARGWVGRDRQKLRFRFQGESAGGDLENAEAQVLYSRMVARFWDLVGGLRHDNRPHPARAYAVVGLKGVAPYRFAVDADAYLSEKGALSARLETEYDLLLTQRVVAQPRLEVNAAARNVDDLGRGAGVGDVELGLRLRYEIRRELAPYVGVSRVWKTGGTADRVRAVGGQVAGTAWVAGLRLWY